MPSSSDRLIERIERMAAMEGELRGLKEVVQELRDEVRDLRKERHASPQSMDKLEGRVRWLEMALAGGVFYEGWSFFGPVGAS